MSGDLTSLQNHVEICTYPQPVRLLSFSCLDLEKGWIHSASSNLIQRLKMQLLRFSTVSSRVGANTGCNETSIITVLESIVQNGTR